MRRVLPFALIALAACSGGSRETRPAGAATAWYEDLGHHHRLVSTRSAEAQRAFDQGLTLYFGFNHEEAGRFFARAAELDPDLAMAPWGMALSVGPNINNMAMDEAAARTAHESVERARALAAGASPVERDLIEALSARYVWPPPENRAGLDSAYAGAMREVWRKHPGDPDVGALCAESLMDLRPWDLWSPAGEPRPETPEIVETLEAVFAVQIDHPGANHFLIHTMEASPHPERALPAADRLRNLVPGAGHLVHMPSHIDIRTGRYDEAIVANQAGIAADLRYVARGLPRGFYDIYRAHNYHFLAYAAMFDGRRRIALDAAREMVTQLPLEVVRQFPDFLDGFLAAPIHVLVRFGAWDELLAEPVPPADLAVTAAFRHYGRTVALSALGRVEEAAAAFDSLRSAYAAVPESRLIGNNTARVVLEIALPMAEGELEYRRGHHDRAFELLRVAVAHDDSLRYDEPWGWMQPVRHALGALLLEQGRVADAEAVYREDLRLHPNNGWALHGLAECQRRSGRMEEAMATEAAFAAAWSRSDTPIRASCFCRTAG